MESDRTENIPTSAVGEFVKNEYFNVYLHISYSCQKNMHPSKHLKHLHAAQLVGFSLERSGDLAGYRHSHFKQNTLV